MLTVDRSMVRRPVSFLLALSLYRKPPHLFGLVPLGLRKLLRCRVRYDALQLWTPSTVSNSLSFSPWHSLSFPVFHTSSPPFRLVWPVIAHHVSLFIATLHPFVFDCPAIPCWHISLSVPQWLCFIFYHCPPSYLLSLLDERRSVKGVDDAGAEAYVGAPCCVPDLSPQGDTIVWHDITNPRYKNYIRNISAR